MAKQKKNRIWLILLIVVLALCVTVGVMYAMQAEIFDRSGWSESEEGIRYLDYYARPQTGWLTIGGERYYFDTEDGLMCTGWQELEGKRYYFDENGALHTGWLEQEAGRYYLSEDGTVFTGWLEQDEGRYYLGDNGIMHTGWLETPEGKRYFGDEGVLHTGWLDTEEGRCYLNDDGILQTGWLMLPEGKYYLSDEGIAQTGWLDTDEGRYYLADDGRMHTGWLEWENERYYLREDGTMALGKVTVDGVDRHFSSTGKYVVVVNKWNPVPEDYETELVKVSGYQVSQECAQALEEMLAACRKAGYSTKINSAYRSKERQQQIWDKRYNAYISSGKTKEKAKQLVQSSVAVPGTSEHQLGLAVDLGGGSAAHKWLAKHSWEYGFHLRYPEGKTEVTGIIHEPWHFRYLGKELAKELYDAGLTVEEYMDQLTKE